MTLEELLIQKIGNEYITDGMNILAIFPYGSRVYNIHSVDSDYDFVVINELVDYQYESEYLDIHFLTEDTFIDLLNEHDPMALECYFYPEPIKEWKNKPEFKVEKAILRKSFSKIISNSWVKAKKKFRQGDNYKGLKSLFHSFRLIDFGCRLAENGYIKFYDSRELFDLFFELKNEVKSENDIQKVKPLHNKMITEFRKLAPK